MKPYLIAPLLLGVACAAQAADTPKSDTPADYAYALPLQVSGKQGVVGLRLPPTVYQHARNAGLDDLRIFDAKGQRQPHSLYRPPVTAPEQRARLPATIFAVKAQPDNGANAVDLDIRTRADGSVVSVQTRSGKNAAGDTKLGSLILDFGAAATADNTSIEALRFTPPAGQRDYTAEVWLETSSNLKDWDTAGAAELRWLTSDSAQTLASDRLEFTPRAFRYARLTWRRGEALTFAAIQAETVTRQAAEPPRDTLWIQPAAGRQAGDLAYPAGVAIPVEQIALRFSEPNIVYPVALGQYVERPSRHRDSGKPTEWIFQPQAQATFFQITQNGKVRSSGPAAIGGHAQEWVIRPQNQGASARPELGISWQPATVVFLAGGTPPYTLNFGRADADNVTQSLNQVAPNFSVQELGQLEQAQVGVLQNGPGGVDAESAALQASQAARKRGYALWGVLLLGVLVLAGLTWKLVKQMKNETPGNPGESV